MEEGNEAQTRPCSLNDIVEEGNEAQTRPCSLNDIVEEGNEALNFKDDSED